MEQCCKFCNNKVKVAPYFYNEMIEKKISYIVEPPQAVYTAKVDFRYICPYCGTETIDFKERELNKTDIVNLVF